MAQGMASPRRLCQIFPGKEPRRRRLHLPSAKVEDHGFVGLKDVVQHEDNWNVLLESE